MASIYQKSAIPSHLQKYFTPAEIGLEKTPEEYVAKMVAIFREVRRVLRIDGTLWLNLGPSSLGGGNGGGGSFASERPGLSVFGGSDPNQSRRAPRAPSCGTDGIEPQCLTASGSAYPDLCDGCLADYASHRASIAGSDRPTTQSAQPNEPTSRDSARSDYASASQGASPPDAQESTSLRSWLLRRGACSRCDSRASALSGVRSSSGDALEFSHMTWLDYTTRLKHKDIVPIPWMVAMALQDDGWWLRQDIIWAKKNCMPESVTDRPTRSHEYIFLMTKSPKYFYDADAIKEPAIYFEDARKNREKENQKSNPTEKHNGIRPLYKDAKSFDGKHSDKQRGHVRRHAGFNDRWDQMTKEEQCGAMRNKRSVWSVATQPFAEAHFATFPEKLIEPCILAGSPEKGIVLDPFMGAGTTALVSARLNRNFIGIELNPKYIEIAEKRIRPEMAQGKLAIGNIR